MRRIITTIAVAIATICTINAQEIKLGARAGVNFATLPSDEVIATGLGTTTTVKTEYGFRTGFHFGAFAEYGFNDKLFLEAGISYSSQGAKLKSIETTTKSPLGTISGKVNVDDTTTILNQLNVPIWLKYDFAGFRPKVGLNFGYLANMKTKTSDKTESVDPDKRFDFGIGIGAEYNLDMGLFFDANFTYGLTNLSNNNDTPLKNRVIQIGVGYKF